MFWDMFISNCQFNISFHDISWWYVLQDVSLLYSFQIPQKLSQFQDRLEHNFVQWAGRSCNLATIWIWIKYQIDSILNSDWGFKSLIQSWIWILNSESEFWQNQQKAVVNSSKKHITEMIHVFQIYLTSTSACCSHPVEACWTCTLQGWLSFYLQSLVGSCWEVMWIYDDMGIS